MISDETQRRDIAFVGYRAWKDGRLPERMADAAVEDGLDPDLVGGRANLELMCLLLSDALASARQDENKAVANLHRAIQTVREAFSKTNPSAVEWFSCKAGQLAIEIDNSRWRRNRRARHFGIVLGLIELCKRWGMRPGGEVLCSAIKDLEGGSVTDTKNAISAYTDSIGLTLADWTDDKSVH